MPSLGKWKGGEHDSILGYENTYSMRYVLFAGSGFGNPRDQSRERLFIFGLIAGVNAALVSLYYLFLFAQAMKSCHCCMVDTGHVVIYIP